MAMQFGLALAYCKLVSGARSTWKMLISTFVGTMPQDITVAQFSLARCRASLQFERHFGIDLIPLLHECIITWE